MSARRPSSPPRRQRGLTPEEAELWARVARSIRPLAERQPSSPTARATGPATDPAAGAAAAKPRPGAGAAAPAGAGAPGGRRLRPTGAGSEPPVHLARAAAEVGPAGHGTPGLDARRARALAQGRINPEARLDLHGMTAERARRALDRFIGEALGRGLRLVLVITGKGVGRPGGPDAPFMRSGEGVLRRQVPRWLRAGPHAARIVGIFEAHRRHGGAGALYVYLKRPR